MIIHTIKGVLYEVTAPGECVVSAPVESNGYYTLARLPEGGQAVVAATGDHMVVSDEGARVVQYLEHKAFEAHVGNAAVHLSEAEREALYYNYSVATPVGDSNAYFAWFELSEVWVRAGFLSRITLQCRTAGEQMTMEPRYLAVWENDEERGWVQVGVSKDMQKQALGAIVTWNFDEVRISGRPLRFVMMERRDQGWNSESTFGARCAPVEDGSNLAGGYRYVPECVLAIKGLDGGRKLSADEAAFLEYLLANRVFLEYLITNGDLLNI